MPAPEPADSRVVAAATVACVVGTIAFAFYTLTLLPGVDPGDTGGFQASVLWPETSARRAYPLYYFLGKIFVGGLSPAVPARGLNLFSALAGGVAIGLLTFVASAITRSRLAGAAAGLLLAASYTFWTQAVIAEVYTLHLLLIAACMVALYAWRERPTLSRLGVFFAVYALSFGNHLGMLLLLVPFTAFLLAAHPRPRELVQPRIVLLAIAIAGAGALQYLPNAIWAWTSIDASPDAAGRLATFWMDTTKSDWRETMVLGVRAEAARDRLAMWWWDARQQFGVAGMIAAALGAVRLWWVARPWAVLTWTAFAISTGFALTYNVGDTHVFLLPSHLMTALAIAAAVAAGHRRWRVALPIALLLYAGWRAWETYPAVDRHDDRRADALVARLTTGVDERNAILLSRMNWEPENALLYAARYERPDLAWIRLAPVLPHLPWLVRDNETIGRDIVLTADAAADVVAAYGTLFPIIRDDTPAAPSLVDTISRIPAGTPYVLTLLEPLPHEGFDQREFTGALQVLTGAAGREGPPYEPGDRGSPPIDRRAPPIAPIDRRAPLYGAPGAQRYQVWAGLAGERPAMYRGGDRPFRDRVVLLGDAFTIRMDAWLPADTFRRGGFGHVIRGRERVLFVERGVSLVWFRADGSPVMVYAAGVYAPRPRFRIPASTPQLAGTQTGQMP